MTAKYKTRKASAPKARAPVFDAARDEAVIELAMEFGCDKLDGAHHEMWDGLNFLTLIEVAADKAIDDRDNAENYAHATSTAVRAAIGKFNRAYDLIDECNRQMTQKLMRETDAGKGIAAAAAKPPTRAQP